MSDKTLVTYGSKYGATAEIAARIGETLAAAGVDVAVLPAGEVQDVSPYRAVVLGAAVYAGSWHKDASQFLAGQEAALAEKPVWFFSSGPTGEGDPVTLLKGWRLPQAQQAAADHIKPRDIAVFHGALDMGKLNFAERLILKAMKVPVGDFRDWESIGEWARGIARELVV